MVGVYKGGKKIKNKVDYSLICSLVKVFGNRFVSNNPPWCRLGELKRPTLYVQQQCEDGGG